MGGGSHRAGHTLLQQGALEGTGTIQCGQSPLWSPLDACPGTQSSAAQCRQEFHGCLTSSFIGGRILTAPWPLPLKASRPTPHTFGRPVGTNSAPGPGFTASLWAAGGMGSKGVPSPESWRQSLAHKIAHIACCVSNRGHSGQGSPCGC